MLQNLMEQRYGERSRMRYAFLLEDVEEDAYEALGWKDEGGDAWRSWSRPISNKDCYARMIMMMMIIMMCTYRCHRLFVISSDAQYMTPSAFFLSCRTWRPKNRDSDATLCDCVNPSNVDPNTILTVCNSSSVSVSTGSGPFNVDENCVHFEYSYQ